MGLLTGVEPVKKYWNRKIAKSRDIILSLKYVLSYPFLVRLAWQSLLDLLGPWVLYPW
jgi:hypothetical protein